MVKNIKYKNDKSLSPTYVLQPFSSFPQLQLCIFFQIYFMPGSILINLVLHLALFTSTYILIWHDLKYILLSEFPHVEDKLLEAELVNQRSFLL